MTNPRRKYKATENDLERSRQWKRDHPEKVKEYNERHYKTEKYKATTKARYSQSLLCVKKWRQKLKLVSLAFFGGKFTTLGYCYECFEEFTEDEVLTKNVQFDHVKGPKSFGAAQAPSQTAYIAEIYSKCEPVHLHCHTKRGSQRGQAKLKLTAEGWIPRLPGERAHEKKN